MDGRDCSALVIRLFRDGSATKMKKYTTKKGHHDWWPFEFPRMWFVKKKRITLTFTFDVDCIYDWNGDQDQLDWNKIGGVSFNLFSNTKNSIIGGWRSNPITRKIELTIYRHVAGNILKGNDDGEVMMTVDPFDVIELTIWPQLNGRFFCAQLQHDDQVIMIPVEYPEVKKIGRRIGMWFGGANNSPGEFGGVSSKSMTAWIKFDLQNR